MAFVMVNSRWPVAILPPPVNWSLQVADLGRRVMRTRKGGDVGPDRGLVGERPLQRTAIDLERQRRRVLEHETGLDPQRRGLALEVDDGDEVAEHIIDPAHRSRLWRDLEIGLDQPLVVRIARPEHQPMFAETDGGTIGIGGDVADAQYAHISRQ